MGRLTPSAAQGRLPEPEPHPVVSRYATDSEVSHATVAHALCRIGCPQRVHRGRLCGPRPWRGGHLPRYDRDPAVRYGYADPAAAVQEHATRLRLRSWPLRLLALSLPDE